MKPALEGPALELAEEDPSRGHLGLRVALDPDQAQVGLGQAQEERSALLGVELLDLLARVELDRSAETLEERAREPRREGLGEAALALGQAAFVLGIALAWAARNGPDHFHWGVVGGAGASLCGALAWGLRASLRDKSFVAATISAATLLFPVAWLASQCIGPHGALVAYEPAPKLALEAALFGWQASLTFAAAGICLATRLGAGTAAGGTLLLFVLGSLVRGPLGTDSIGALGHLSLLLPDLQLYWVGDAGYAEKPIPLDYLAQVLICTLLYTQIALGLASFSLERREFA